jgi:hypothetical protein
MCYDPVNSSLTDLYTGEKALSLDKKQTEMMAALLHKIL